MRAILCYPDGHRTEVLVLSISRYAMRVLARGSADTVELTSSYGEWTDERGVRIEFESFVAVDADQVRTLLRNARETCRAIA